MDDRALLGKRVQELRKGRGLSQEQLAEKMGVNAKYLGFIEQGRANPTLQLFINLSKSLKVDLVDLFNYSWLRISEGELRKKIRAMADDADLTRLREIFSLMKTRDL